MRTGEYRVLGRAVLGVLRSRPGPALTHSPAYALRSMPKIPVSGIPVSEIPVLEIPVLEISVSEIPVLEIPVSEIPVSEIPVYWSPSTGARLLEPVYGARLQLQ